MKKNKQKVLVMNIYGIPMVKCCASCQHKCLDDLARRKCQLTGKSVRGCYVCGEWQMSEQLATLGCEHGKVQRREYQLTLMEVRTSELLAVSKGEDIVPKTLEEIRDSFEKEHKSRYLF